MQCSHNDGSESAVDKQTLRHVMFDLQQDWSQAALIEEKHQYELITPLTFHWTYFFWLLWHIEKRYVLLTNILYEQRLQILVAVGLWQTEITRKRRRAAVNDRLLNDNV